MSEQSVKDKKLTRMKVADNDVIHVLRSTHSNQAGLIALADQKSNVIIGIIAVILTLLFTNTAFLQTLDRLSILLLIVCVFTELLALFFALLVIMPKSANDSSNSKIESISNPLFFGLFTKFKEDEYVNHLIENIDNNLSARQHMAIDIYQTGHVLKRKYLFLKYAYTLAACGTVLIVLLGIISISFN